MRSDLKSFQTGLLEPAGRRSEVGSSDPASKTVYSRKVISRKTASRKSLPSILVRILADAGSRPGEYVERWTAGRGAE
jgi:hypothetical protein